MRSRTLLLNSALVLSGTYQACTPDLGNIGDLSVNGENQINFLMTGTSAGGDNITLKIQELFSFQTAGVEQISWADRLEDSDTTAGALEVLERTFDLAVQAGTPFSFDISTHATNVRIMLKGQGTIEVYANVARVS